jgi:hypothetical protein
MKRWPKEDRYSWEKSDVMREFESRILSNYATLEKMAQQKKLDINSVKAVGAELQKVKQTAQELSAMFADDGQADHTEDCAVCQSESEINDEYTDNEVALAKSEILSELRKMADNAIMDRDIKLAYRIERTISEIEEE